MNIYLHIGQHKTGTSYLQQIFYQNRQLLSQHNIYYPISQIHSFAHHRLAWYLDSNIKKPKKDILLDHKFDTDEFLSEINGCHQNILLSSEVFELIPDTKEVKNFFANHNLFVIIFIRDLVEYLQSFYAECIKHGEFLSASEWIDLKINEGCFNRLNLINQWKSICTKIYVKNYSKNNLLNTFLDTLNINLDINNFDIPMPVKNKTNLYSLELLRVANMYNLSYSQHENIKLLMNSSNILNCKNPALLDNVMFSDKIKKKIIKHTKKWENKVLAMIV